VVGILSPDAVAALQSLRNSYMHQRQVLTGQAGSHAAAGLATVTKLIAVVDKALATGEAPIAALTGILRASAKFIGTPIARLSRGETVRLLAVGGTTPGGPNRGWWQVQTRAGISGWIDRKEIFPDAPRAITSQAGLGGPSDSSHREEIELGARDTVVF
jgi:hypothetical protein